MASMSEIVPISDKQLVLLEAIRKDVEQVHSIPEARAYTHITKEAADLTAKMGHAKGAADDLMEKHLYWWRRLGQLLAKTPLSRGAAQKRTQTQDAFTLRDLGIEDTESSRAQRAASIPEKTFKQHIKLLRERDGDFTKQYFLRLAKELEREKKREENRALVEESEAPVITDTFSTLVLDPPWDWGDEGDVSQLGRGDPTYATLSLEGIRDLEPYKDGRRIGDFAKENAHLYLWITNRSLPKGFALLEAWGFRYVTCLTWCKPSFGMGNYFRGSTEHILFGVRGSLALLRKDVGTWFTAARQGKHSTKPQEFYELVETCSPGPWLEVFSREERPGWICWGAEV